MSTLAVRPAIAQDEIFLYDLYAAIRGPEFAMAPLTPTQREHLIRIQFRGQMTSYAEMFPNSCYHVVLLDSKPVGRLWVAPGNAEFHLVDIAVHPDYQKKGIGGVLVRRLQQEAEKARLPIRSSVFRYNEGSLRFHRRMGFAIAREDQMHYYMEWRPTPVF